MGFPRQEYWSGLLCLPPGDLPDPGIKASSPALQADSLPSEPPGKPYSLTTQRLVQPGIIWFLHSFACLFSPLRIVIHNQQGPTVKHRELCSVLCGSLDGRGVWRRMDTRVCMAGSICCSPKTQNTVKSRAKSLRMLSHFSCV